MNENKSSLSVFKGHLVEHKLKQSLFVMQLIYHEAFLKNLCNFTPCLYIMIYSSHTEHDKCGVIVTNARIELNPLLHVYYKDCDTITHQFLLLWIHMRREQLHHHIIRLPTAISAWLLQDVHQAPLTTHPSLSPFCSHSTAVPWGCFGAVAATAAHVFRVCKALLLQCVELRMSTCQDLYPGAIWFWRDCMHCT